MYDFSEKKEMLRTPLKLTKGIKNLFIVYKINIKKQL